MNTSSPPGARSELTLRVLGAADEAVTLELVAPSACVRALNLTVGAAGCVECALTEVAAPEPIDSTDRLAVPNATSARRQLVQQRGVGREVALTRE